ncbi:alpha-L-rhamnosidase C-terminal domain-containing protein [Arthrobacter sp. B2a2-09]|uniref:alpha-L-rhamnosidase C-terminal domain-containing protein n=1 Tax=Arthrobacter sp. B2a2-09 TaxID=2952822 RepID=UPI003FA4ABC7
MRPLEPGYSRFLIAPVPGEGIDACPAELLSPFGLIRTQWTMTDGAFQITVDVPAGTAAVVRTPHGGEHELGPGFHELASTGTVGETTRAHREAKFSP